MTLLRRCRSLLRPHGTVLVELELAGVGLWRGYAHVVTATARGRPQLGSAFRWAWLDCAGGARHRQRRWVDGGEVFRAAGRWFGGLLR